MKRTKKLAFLAVITALMAALAPTAALGVTETGELEDTDICALYYKASDGNYTLVIQNGDQNNAGNQFGTLEPDRTALICGGEESDYDDEDGESTSQCRCFDRSEWQDSSLSDKITAVHVLGNQADRTMVYPHSLSSWFEGFVNCTTFDLAGLNTSQAGFMAFAFKDCKSLKSFDMTTLNTSNAFNLTSMFEGCSALESVKFAADGNASFMWGMFKNCTSLKNIDTSTVNPVSVDRIDEMFAGCTALKTANLTGLDTTYSSSATSVFEGCTALEEVNLSNFSTLSPNGEYGPLSEYGNGITNFFKNCQMLKKISLGDRCDMASVIPTPSSTYIANATGKWVNERGEEFTARAIPSYTAGIYTAQLKAPGSESTNNPDASGSNANIPNTNTPNTSVTPTPSQSLTSIARASMSVERKTLTYNGKALMPGVVLNYQGRVLRPGIDYTIAYAKNKNVGTATVTAKGKGAYTGSKSVTFKIVPKGTPISKLSKGKKSFTIKWKKLSKAHMKQITGYEVKYSLKKSMKGAKTKTVKASSKDGKKCTLKVTKLKGGKKYCVQVRTYKTVNGKKYYSSWSKTKTVKTKK